VPHEINNGDVIEFIIAGDNYYTILKGKRIFLEVIQLRKRKDEPRSSKPVVKEHDDDYLE
jgi:hypothetical protein